MPESRLSRSPSLLAACADDIGMVAQGVNRSLAPLPPVFQRVAAAAGLTLGATKTFIILLQRVMPERHLSLMVAASLPSEFRVVEPAKYPGIYLGRGVGL
eukprot:2780615-Pyramimonas_sp.AAC.1